MELAFAALASKIMATHYAWANLSQLLDYTSALKGTSCLVAAGRAGSVYFINKIIV